MQDQHPPSASLNRRALSGTLKFFAVLAVLIFVSAGSLRYWQGWVCLVHFFAWSAGTTLYFLKRDPALVERRLKAGPTAEREAGQKRIQLLASLVICATFIVSALDHRFGWSSISGLGVLTGNALLALGFWIVVVVFKANSFASAIIEVGAGQKVISTGPYAWVRHPMYSGALIMFGGIPPALGSWWGLLTLPLLAAILAVRLLDEERYLTRNLPGYGDYCARVRYRLVPGLW
jgi:protein-S-isoprenylcysteine O-methyltransferase Ste14